MKLDGFQRLAIATTAATYLLIGVGGLVRAAGAGLGCPEWPRCFGGWIPPFDASGVPPEFDAAQFNVVLAWMEYINRLIGVVVGLLILSTLIFAVRRHRRSPRVLWPTVAAFLLVVFQGWLGGQVVQSSLHPLVLTAHLGFALVIVSLLLYATVSAFFPSGGPLVPIGGRRLWVARTTLLAIGLVLVQAALGAWVRGEVQALAEAGVPREMWGGELGIVHGIHRNYAILLTAGLLLLVWAVGVLDAEDSWLRRTCRAVLGLVAVQVGAGVGLSDYGFPRALQVVHLWCAALLLGALTVLALLLYRLDPRFERPALSDAKRKPMVWGKQAPSP
ncbi:MAG: heme A synthase [Myxococcota bacterium]